MGFLGHIEKVEKEILAGDGAREAEGRKKVSERRNLDSGSFQKTFELEKVGSIG